MYGLENLEEDVIVLQEENERLKSELTSLEAELLDCQREIRRLRGIVREWEDELCQNPDT